MTERDTERERDSACVCVAQWRRHHRRSERSLRKHELARSSWSGAVSAEPRPARTANKVHV